MDVRDYARSLVQLINSVFQRDKISAGLLSIVQGPTTITYRVGLMDPTRQQIKVVLDMGDVLQAKMLVEACRIQMNGGVVEIQIPVPEQFICTPTAADMLAGTEGLNACLGWTMYGEPACVDLTQHGALFWVGPSRRGKTQSMRSTLFAMARSYGALLRYAIICQPAPNKLADWAPFDQSKHSMGILTSTEEINDAVKWLAWRTQVGVKEFKFVLVIDDLPSILARCDIETDLATIASVGAGVGIHLLAGTQTAGSKQGSGGEVIESNITARVLYKPASKATAARNAGEGGLDLDQLSTIKGDALLRVDGHNERIATSLALDSEIQQLAQGRIEKLYRPWYRADQVNREVKGAITTVQTTVPSTVQNHRTDKIDDSTLENRQNDAVTTQPPYSTVQDMIWRNFRLQAKDNLSEQEKLLLYGAYLFFGSKNATIRNVFGSEGGKQFKILNDAISFAESMEEQRS